jgi:regulatory protein
LRQLHYLDDGRFAREAAGAAQRRGQGSERVRADLTAKGVAESLIEAAVAAAFEDEAELAQRALAQQYPAGAHSAPERAKAARFLLRRGFPEAVVLGLLGEDIS